MVIKAGKRKQETKEYIEKFLNDFLKEDIVGRVAWVVNAVPLSDLRDVAVGYVIGVTYGYLERYGVIKELLDGGKLDSEDYRNLMAAFKKTLPKIVEKVEKEFCE